MKSKKVMRLHGGKRDGAGRPKTGRKARQIWLSDEEHKLVKVFINSLKGGDAGMVKSYTVEGYLSCEENDERPGIYFNKEDLLGEHDLGSIPNIFFIDEFAKFNGKKVKITIQEVEENTTSCETLSTAHCGAGAYIKILKNCTGCIHWPAPVGASNGGYPCDHCKAVENGKPTNWRG